MTHAHFSTMIALAAALAMPPPAQGEAATQAQRGKPATSASPRKPPTRDRAASQAGSEAAGRSRPWRRPR